MNSKIREAAWVGKLRRQLKRAGEEDADFSRFGAYEHKYQLNSPASEEPHLLCFEEPP